MLPTLRLLIAAMLATVVVLICGFGIFATFRVSHDPIAHLPTAAVPLQMVAEAGAGSGALPAARDSADPRSQFDVPMNVPQAAGPAAPTVEPRDEAEFADARPPAAQSPSRGGDRYLRGRRRALKLLRAHGATLPNNPCGRNTKTSTIGRNKMT